MKGILRQYEATALSNYEDMAIIVFLCSTYTCMSVVPNLLVMRDH